MKSRHTSVKKKLKCVIQVEGKLDGIKGSWKALIWHCFSRKCTLDCEAACSSSKFLGNPVFYLITGKLMRNIRNKFLFVKCVKKKSTGKAYFEFFCNTNVWKIFWGIWQTQNSQISSPKRNNIKIATKAPQQIWSFCEKKQCFHFSLGIKCR